MRVTPERNPRSAGAPASPSPPVATSRTALRDAVALWRRDGDSVGLVPTMGALHAGHLALVDAARNAARRIVVSIFVNPTQFSPTEDLDRYPRTFAADCALLADAGADLIYAPPAAEMYPPGFSARIEPGGAARAGLEDASRPHFFGGVATVVAKLLLQVRPDCATFGEKDYQQLRVVSALVRDLDLPVEIVPVSTVREADGLALSSRNRFLSADERGRARFLYAMLVQAAAAIRSGADVEAAAHDAAHALSRAGFGVDYFEGRHAVTLAPIDRLQNGPIRLLVAARWGSVRLIDNIGV